MLIKYVISSMWAVKKKGEDYIIPIHYKQVK